MFDKYKPRKPRKFDRGDSVVFEGVKGVVSGYCELPDRRIIYIVRMSDGRANAAMLEQDELDESG